VAFYTYTALLKNKNCEVTWGSERKYLYEKITKFIKRLNN
jgi:hypothetical protein